MRLAGLYFDHSFNGSHLDIHLGCHLDKIIFRKASVPILRCKFQRYCVAVDTDSVFKYIRRLNLVGT